jgi:prepilin-type N-terminal cleavage/methylation domain-containing protein
MTHGQLWWNNTPGEPPGGARGAAFTMVELLLVIAVLGLLLSILAPALMGVRTLAKVTRAQAELAGLAKALLTYHEQQHAYPPARTYCEHGPAGKAPDWAELPRELAAEYYAPGPPGSSLTLNAEDPFNPGRTYKYLKAGRGYHNNAATFISLWIPDNFPDGDCSSGRYYSNEADCPVSFVLWSVGTFGDIGYWNALEQHHPFDRHQWYRGAGEQGLIVRAWTATGQAVFCP